MIKLLDCTLRDGGYYNSWNFSKELIEQYLLTMSALNIDFVELGLRSVINNSFKGPMAYTSDLYLETLSIPDNLTIGVMINASELVQQPSVESVLSKLFPKNAQISKVSLVRIACHYHEFIKVLPASLWLKEQGYMVGFNIMQVSDITKKEIEQITIEAQKWPIDVLYFADSLGSIDPQKTKKIVSWIRKNWHGDIGIHAHDNLRKAIQNTLTAAESGVSWLDATITGMGRGPGNAQTEYLITEVYEQRNQSYNIVPLLELIDKTFLPMQTKYRWGTNVYYYLAGKYGIHPTFIQNMLADSRYNAEDILAAIEHLKSVGGKKFSLDTLESARNFYKKEVQGSWNPETFINNREVLILGAGPNGHIHHKAIEQYILQCKPLVIALNTISPIKHSLIDIHIASHPIRLLADCETYKTLNKPLVMPFSMLPDDIRHSLKNNKVFDYGISIQKDLFEFNKNSCVIPTSLVIAYALAIVTAGKANRILLAGFDGYGSDDPRTIEIQKLFSLYKMNNKALEIVSVTPTKYEIQTQSIYAM